MIPPASMSSCLILGWSCSRKRVIKNVKNDSSHAENQGVSRIIVFQIKTRIRMRIVKRGGGILGKKTRTE